MRLIRVSWLYGVRAFRAIRLPVRLCALGAGGVVALVLAGCGQFTTAQPGPYYPNLGALPSPTATLAPAGYTVAAWPANSEPSTSADNTIYVAFRDAGSPVPGAQVTLYAQTGGSAQSYGPRDTGASGYAAFTLSGLAERANRPVLVQVSVTFQGQNFTATTDFTPAP